MLKAANEWLPRIRAGCDNPGVQSLYKMLTVYAKDYLWMGSVLEGLSSAAASDDYHETILRILPEIDVHCRRIELQGTAAIIQSWIREIQRGGQYQALKAECAIRHIDEAIRSELKEVRFFYIEKAKPKSMKRWFLKWTRRASLVSSMMLHGPSLLYS